MTEDKPNNGLLAAAIKAEQLLDALMSFYGQGLEVANWHLNGDLEPFDNLVDHHSDGTELTELRAAIAKARDNQARQDNHVPDVLRQPS